MNFSNQVLMIFEVRDISQVMLFERNTLKTRASICQGENTEHFD